MSSGAGYSHYGIGHETGEERASSEDAAEDDEEGGEHDGPPSGEH